MDIILNGKKEQIKDSITILELLNEKSLDLKGLVIMLNDEIIKKEQWENKSLKIDDQLEVLNFVSGG